MRSFGSACSMRSARIASRALREQGAVGADQHVLGDLLGDGRGAAHAPARAVLLQVGDHGAQDADRVDAVVLPEALVLGADEGLLDTRGGMASIGTKTRRSAASSAISRLSAA